MASGDALVAGACRRGDRSVLPLRMPENLRSAQWMRRCWLLSMPVLTLRASFPDRGGMLRRSSSAIPAPARAALWRRGGVRCSSATPL